MTGGLGLQGSLLLLMVVASAALTFVVPKPRLLWSLLLAAVCGFCAGRLVGGPYALFGPAMGVATWLLLVVPPGVLGAGFAWRPRRWNGAAGWLGIPYGTAVFAGILSNCWSSDCGEPIIGAIFIFAVIGAVLAGAGAALTLGLHAMARRLRS